MGYGFGWALKQLRQGNRVCRTGWGGKGWLEFRMWLEVQVPDKVTLPYIYMKTAQGDLVPWLANQTDILAVDWRER